MEFKDILIPVKTKQSPVGTLQFEETRKWPGCSSEAIVFIFPVVTLAAVMFEELVMKIKCELCVILCITNVSFIYIYIPDSDFLWLFILHVLLDPWILFQYLLIVIVLFKLQ